MPADTVPYTNKVGQGRADLYLVLDEVAAVTHQNLDRCDPARTAAVINTDILPTGQMVRDVWHTLDRNGISSAVSRFTQAISTVPARTIAEKLFGDYMMTNLVVIGAAFQAGLLPLTGESIERAIRLNGVEAESNTLAFRYGRMWVQDPDRVREIIEPAPRNADQERKYRQASLAPKHRSQYEALNARVDEVELPDETRRLLAVRLAELIDYQSVEWARQYLDRVLSVWNEIETRAPGEVEIVETVVRNLYKLMAYKDEYEVARLFLRPEWRDKVRATFEHPVKVSYNLHPPSLRYFGRDRKIRLGPWFTPVFRVLRAGRRLRGTRLDPFGIQQSRREERDLIAWYEHLLDEAISALTPMTAPAVLAIAELPDRVRGYESIKSGNAVVARQRAKTMLLNLTRAKLPMLSLTLDVPVPNRPVDVSVSDGHEDEGA